MAWTLGRIFGIPIRLHFTMVLVPFLTFNWMPVSGVVGVLVWASIVVLIFGSVLLHELGHALMARRFGISTQDIVLTPIGGMARVVRMPSNPKQEIAIAVAGPIVSLLLGGMAFAAIIPLSLIPVLPGVVYDGAFLFLWVNLMLGLFNLVPALPMDGGRVLRGILALKRDHLSATIIAARVGRIIAALGVAVAVVDGSFTLGLISVFVYIAAGSEVRMAQMRAFHDQMADGPFGDSAGTPFGQGKRGVWTWSRTWGGDSPHMRVRPVRPVSRRPFSRDPGGSSGDGEWSDSEMVGDREVLVVGGKAEVIDRNDPETDK
jgi:Zn-dependent protease